MFSLVPCMKLIVGFKCTLDTVTRRVCWLVGSFVRYSRCDFRKSKTPIDWHRGSVLSIRVIFHCELVRGQLGSKLPYWKSTCFFTYQQKHVGTNAMNMTSDNIQRDGLAKTFPYYTSPIAIWWTDVELASKLMQTRWQRADLADWPLVVCLCVCVRAWCMIVLSVRLPSPRAH